MLSNFFKIAWRNLAREKLFTFLNLLGLSTGLTVVLLIFLWVSDELRTDKFNEKDAQLYEVMKKVVDDNGLVHIFSNTQGVLAQSMAAELPEIEYAVQVKKDKNNGILVLNDKHIRVNHEFVGQDFFNVFTYPMIVGGDQPFSGVSDVILSDRLALKLFNSTDIVGKTVYWNYKSGNIDFSGPYRVSAVFKAPPANATNQFDLLLGFDLYAQKHAGGMGDVTFWGSNMVSTYMILKKNVDLVAFKAKIKDFSKSKIKILYSENAEMQQYEGELFIRKFSDAYLFNNYVDGIQVGGRIEYVKLFSIIAIFILLIACINFMNLSTAKATRRIKEVGIRKVIGAPLRILILQHLTEAILAAILAAFMALLFAYLLLPVFRIIANKDLTINLNLQLIFSVLCITLLAGIISGLYPAFYLSKFKPVAVLKGQVTSMAHESFVRKGLVIFQFVISTVLCISVIVIYQQINLIQTKNLGYNKENIIRFSNDGKLMNQSETFLNELRNIPGVVNAATMNGDFLGHEGHSGGGISWEGKDPKLSLNYYGVSGDYHFMDLLELKLTDGRSFSPLFGTDSVSVIFNESAIVAMGIQDPIGREVSLWGKRKKIIGIVKDFYYESFYKKIGPAFLEYANNSESILIKIKSGTEKESLKSVAKVYQAFNPGTPFEYKFLDDDYQSLYSSEMRVAALTKYFALIALLLSCLGLFGVAAFTAQKRLREVSIRKVIGASISDVIKLLSVDFLILVFISFVIAFPLAWWSLNRWLGEFAYRINLGMGVFLMTGITILFIAIFTVGSQALRAAISNPIHNLRSE